MDSCNVLGLSIKGPIIYDAVREQNSQRENRSRYSFNTRMMIGGIDDEKVSNCIRVYSNIISRL